MNKTNDSVVKTWTAADGTMPGMAVYLMPNGCLLRAEALRPRSKPAVYGNCGFPGGRVVLYNWNGTPIWHYTINTNTEQQTHDIFPMANGHVLVDVWEWITGEQIKNAGRRNFQGAGFWSAAVWELQPDTTNGKDTAKVVWKWHFWDHIDSTATSPYLLNVFDTGTSSDGPSVWIHMNAVTYNEQLHQIIVSSRNLNEFYIIERTDTLGQSAGHTGGRYGHGGDFLYRWGNPAAYGVDSPQHLFGQHSPYWLDSAGTQIMVNNDGFKRTPYDTTTANILIVPCVNGVYSPSAASGYLPANAFSPLDYQAPDTLTSTFEGSSQLLPNGNLLIDAAVPDSIPGAAVFYEVNPVSKQILWDYHVPTGAFRAHLYSTGYVDSIFNAQPAPKAK